MNLKLTGRDLKFFFLGIVTTFLFVTIYDWEENVESFKRGFYDGFTDSPMKE